LSNLTLERQSVQEYRREENRDARLNLKKSRDANNVGFDAVYDNLGRQVSMTDTWGDVIEAGYDKEGNVVSTTDAKDEVATSVYDARNRRKTTVDRIAAATQFSYDRNSNLLSLTDAESQPTSYEYSDRNERIKETYPDHVLRSTSGQPGYGIVEVGYDEIGRMQLRTDQNGDTMTSVYDMASRLLRREYRLKVNSPTGLIADQDTMTYDRASRMTSGTSGRYGNTVTHDFDVIGRLNLESLTIGGQTYAATHQFDARSLRTMTTYPNNSVWERTYTARQQLYQTTWNGAVVDTRAYDLGARLDTSTYGNGVINDYNYREDIPNNKRDNQLSGITFTHPGGVASNRQIGSYGYTWDANKNKTKETISGQIAGYSFDTTLGSDPDGYF